MNEKEIAEIRRRFRPDKSNISHVRGCYVNEKREIISQFNQSLAITSQEETDKLLGILKKTLSGTLGKNLIDISFDTNQVVHGEEHKLLMALRDSSLGDEEAVQAFFQRVIQGTVLEGNYLIVLACDTYDVPYRSKDGERLEDASTEVFSYFLCGVCPLKQTKPALSYYFSDCMFHSLDADLIVCAPELGFLFPAFDDRSANIYNALYYTRDAAENHPEFVDAVFRTQIPMPAAAQKETFASVLGETLEEECSLEVVQSVHEQLCEMIEEHKANKEEEPLLIGKNTVRQVLAACGVSKPHVEAFGERYDTAFGEDLDLSPRNLVDTKQLEISTPSVQIKVDSQRGDLIETRVINGIKYLLIRADEGVEVNGVEIRITE